MDKFVIQGGVALRGDVQTGTAKNSVLPLLAATLLTRGTCRILDVPQLRDVDTMLKILGALGVECTRGDDGAITTRVVDESRVEAPYDMVKTMRASVCVLGPLLGRRKRARVSFPGGCVFGQRPIDLHFKGPTAVRGSGLRGGVAPAPRPCAPAKGHTSSTADPAAPPRLRLEA